MGFTLQERWIPRAVIWVSLAIAMGFVAHGCSRLLVLSVLPLPESTIPAVGAHAAAFGTPRAQTPFNPDTVLARNMFDSVLGPLDSFSIQKTEVAPDPNLPIDPNAPLPNCDGGIRLLGAFAIPKLPEYSFAVVSSGGANSRPYRPGMQVDGTHTIGEVLSQSVTLRKSSGGACQLAMFSSGMPAPTPVSPVSASTESPLVGGLGGSSISEADLNSNIEKVGETSFNINRSFVTRLLDNQSDLMRAARISPVKEGDHMVGVRLSSIRRNSLLNKLGMDNGDVLRTINGFDMSDPSAALQAYARLRNESNLSVSILRGGSPVTLSYNVR